MNRRALILLCVGIVIVADAWGAIDSAKIRYYGLDHIRQPYNGRIRQLIGLNAIQHKAIRSSGFKVYELERIVKQSPGTFDTFYVWRDLDGGKLVTKHFIGTQVMFMRKGDAYLGATDVMWLTLYREGNEVKFTLQR